MWKNVVVNFSMFQFYKRRPIDLNIRVQTSKQTNKKKNHSANNKLTLCTYCPVYKNAWEMSQFKYTLQGPGQINSVLSHSLFVSHVHTQYLRNVATWNKKTKLIGGSTKVLRGWRINVCCLLSEDHTHPSMAHQFTECWVLHSAQ